MLLTVYPRVLGERFLVVFCGFLVCGLSPCARGTLKTTLALTLGARFIPVCSGNAVNVAVNAFESPVYPRVLGERFTSDCTNIFKIGLSPCARGTPAIPTNSAGSKRFIPVCSGNAQSPAAKVLLCPVYPRVLGERGRITRRYHRGFGLSPCARGTPR